MANGSFVKIIGDYIGHPNFPEAQGNIEFKVTWEDVPDIVNNTSTLKLGFWIKTPKGATQCSIFDLGPNYVRNKPITVVVNGVTFSIGEIYLQNIDYTDGEWAMLPYSVIADSTPITDYYTLPTSIAHNADGTKNVSFHLTWKLDDNSQNVWGRELGYSSSEGYYVSRRGTFTENTVFSDTITLTHIPRNAKILTAANFTDEENPVITYSNPAGASVNKLEACISLTGGEDDVPYRDIPKTGSSYTFELTEDEKNVLRIAAKDSQTIAVRFYVKTTINGLTYFDYLTRNFTVVNCNPIINNPTIRDVNSTAFELTGDEDTLIKNYSMVEFGFEPIANKYATIVSQSVQNGSKKVTGLNYGIIDDPESGLFVFSATDSRGLTTERVIEKNVIDYIKPTCNQSFATELVGETDSKIALTITGNYFNGTFGAVSNSLRVEVRFTDNDGVMSEWTELIVDPRFNGNTYEVDVTFSGFDYSKAYTFQSRVIDKLYTVESSQYTVRLLPLFDWSENDFNFNVPVNVNGTIGMNGETILRHTGSSTNNTVLSASGGHIYIRPGGTSDTSSEIRITPQGDMYLKGDIYINGVSLTTILSNAGLM